MIEVETLQGPISVRNCARVPFPSLDFHGTELT
jgi:hypothetical protein